MRPEPDKQVRFAACRSGGGKKARVAASTAAAVRASRGGAASRVRAGLVILNILRSASQITGEYALLFRFMNKNYFLSIAGSKYPNVDIASIKLLM